ncbi:hypothetical protein PHMEG_00036163 [Phytophthora megakarya]|uniref:Uncharacterized protein n=1 Tax=Phytophthora megakarya TaxID=4795 RepID=A0A225UPX9_9STRA|nr:hypothetical protein PHMEG_00036163 [Phytophthora megakarya]
MSKMPTRSAKQALLSRLRTVWRSRLCLASDDEDSSDEYDGMSVVATYLVLASQRYIARRVRVERPLSRVNYYLTRMPDSEFKLQFCMTRPFFLAVCRLIGGYREFQSVPGKQQRSSVELHVMGLLQTLGSLNGQGLIEGTLFPLSQRPEDHGDDYFYARVLMLSTVLLFVMTGSDFGTKISGGRGQAMTIECGGTAK